MSVYPHRSPAERQHGGVCCNPSEYSEALLFPLSPNQWLLMALCWGFLRPYWGVSESGWRQLPKNACACLKSNSNWNGIKQYHNHLIGDQCQISTYQTTVCAWLNVRDLLSVSYKTEFHKLTVAKWQQKPWYTGSNEKSNDHSAVLRVKWNKNKPLPLMMNHLWKV